MQIMKIIEKLLENTEITMDLHYLLQKFQNN